MHTPYISIIVPIYNGERFLKHALTSATTQDLKEIEIICVDDGSSDSSCKIIRQWADNDERIKLLCQSNRGASNARNTGINAAEGKFVTFLDADDWYSGPDFLSTLFNGATQNNQLAAGANFYNYRGPKNIETDFSTSPQFAGYSFPRSGIIEYRNYQFDYGFHRFIFDRTLFAEGHNRFSELTYFEDPIFLTHILDQAQSFYATNNVGYLYRCEYKAAKWDTAKVLDLLEGVRRNLEFSQKHQYSKLHWYTFHHFEKESGNIGIELNRKLDLAVIEPKLQSIEQSIDFNLLRKTDETEVDRKTDMRRAFDESANRGCIQRIKNLARYAWRRL